MLIAVAIAVILVTTSVVAIAVMLSNDTAAKTVQIGNQLALELQEKLKAVKEVYWNDVYALNRGFAYHYFLQSVGSSTGNPFLFQPGEEIITTSGNSFVRYFYIDAVNRGNCGVGNITSSTVTPCNNPGVGSPLDIAPDPSTLKISVVVSSTNQIATTLVGYITRSRNNVFVQSDWSHGPGQEHFPTSTLAQQSSSSASITQTNDGTSQTGFNLGGSTFADTQVVGTGANASIQLSPQ